MQTLVSTGVNPSVSSKAFLVGILQEKNLLYNRKPFSSGTRETLNSSYLKQFVTYCFQNVTMK